jgi:hypothetical protein
MEPTMILARTAALAAVLLGGAGPAAAQFLDCMSDGYLASFPEAPTAEGLACRELFRFEVATPEGPRFMRGIADAGAGWAAPPDLVAEVERGARLAGAAFARLGSFRVDNITLLILDDVHATGDLSGPGDGAVLGTALSDRNLPPGTPPECLLTIYALAPGATDGSMATTVAHEIFHCVQGASYAGPKYQSYVAGGAWWIEGAAEAFAAAAVPESAAHTDRSPEFDAAVAGRVPLNDMAHEAAQFFYWLMQTRGGLAALMPFQDAMAETGGAAAQQAAMRRALSPDEWAAFAQAYADGRITHPQGGTLASAPPEGEVLTIEDAGPFPLPMAPFTLTLGRADYGCGVWANRQRPPAPQLSWKAGGDWQELPAELDTREGGDRAWRLVALPVDEGEGGLSVERRAGCAPCLGSSEIDACLVGTWEVSGGGPEEWMRAQGIRSSFAFDGPRQMTLRRDGLFSTGGFGVTADEAQDGMRMEGEGEVAAAQGTWSVTEGRLNTCIAAGGGMGGEVTITTPDTSGTMATGAPPGGSLSVGYSCAGGELVTTLPMGGGLPAMETRYRRIGD